MRDVAKRLLDIVGSAVGIVLALPVILIAGLAVVLESGRPMFFRQTRSGLLGVPFTILKLRTMRCRVRDEDLPLSEDDPDITHVGRVLRALSIDELPQLLNVLIGHMSLVGPRPTLPEQVAAYDRTQRRRLEVRPGITGWAQVNGRNTLSWDERIELDVWYVDHRSVALDLRILARTVRVCLQRGLNYAPRPAQREEVVE